MLNFPPDNTSVESRAWARAVEQALRDLDRRLTALEQKTLPRRVSDLEGRTDDLRRVLDALVEATPNIVVSPTRPDTTGLPVPTVWIGY